MDSSNRPLTLSERQTLESTVRFRNQPPTLHRVLMSAWPFLSALVLACCALALIGWWKNDYQLALPAMMFFLGVIIRDVQNLHRYTVAWPLTARMLDWQKIDELIAESRAMDATGLAEEIPETRVDS